MTRVPVPTRHPRQRGTKAGTRERLLQAALDLLFEGGEAAVTTVSVTRAAGVVQSLFYQHFKSVEGCLAEATERVTIEIRQTIAASRRRMYETGPGAGADLEQGFRDMFALADQQRPLIQLFLRHRTNPVALQGVMHRLAGGLSADLAAQLRAKFGAAGLDALPAGWLQALADDLVAVSLSALDAFLEGRGPTVEDAVRRLAACSTAMVVTVIQAGTMSGTETD